MISHKHKCIFIHIPKTGGTSIEHIIWPDPEDKTPENLWCNRKQAIKLNKYHNEGLQHLFAKDVKKEVGENIFNSYYKFSFVRNPWDRLVSEYYYHKKITAKNLFKKSKNLFHFIDPFFNTELKDFESFVNSLTQFDSIHLKNQVNFITNNQGKIILDNIYRFEEFSRNINKVLSELKINLYSPIPHLKKTNRGHYKGYYTEKTKNLIGDIYKDDIETFNYSF